MFVDSFSFFYIANKDLQVRNSFILSFNSLMFTLTKLINLLDKGNLLNLWKQGVFVNYFKIIQNISKYFTVFKVPELGVFFWSVFYHVQSGWKTRNCKKSNSYLFAKIFRKILSVDLRPKSVGWNFYHLPALISRVYMRIYIFSFKKTHTQIKLLPLANLFV